MSEVTENEDVSTTASNANGSVEADGEKTFKSSPSATMDYRYQSRFMFAIKFT